MHYILFVFFSLTLTLLSAAEQSMSLAKYREGIPLVDLSRDIVYNFEESKMTWPKIKVFRSLGINDEYINVDYAVMLDCYDTVVVASVMDVELISLTVSNNTRWYRVICKVRSVPRGDFPFEAMAFVTYVNGHCYPWLTYAQDQTFHFGMTQEDGVWEIKHQVRASYFAPYRIEDHVPFHKLKYLDKETDYSKWDALAKSSYSPFGEILAQSGNLADTFTFRFSTKPYCVDNVCMDCVSTNICADCVSDKICMDCVYDHICTNCVNEKLCSNCVSVEICARCLDAQLCSSCVGSQLCGYCVLCRMKSS